MKGLIGFFLVLLVLYVRSFGLVGEVGRVVRFGSRIFRFDLVGVYMVCFTCVLGLVIMCSWSWLSKGELVGVLLRVLFSCLSYVSCHALFF